MKPLAIDLYCGLGGWAEGFLSEGYDVIGFDIESRPYPGQLVLQDVLTLHGAQFKDAAVIVASPPCEEFSRHQMPWTKARNPPEPNLSLVEACWRIRAEAGVPMVLENVRKAQDWLGRARWHSGSFYLWGDVPALMPTVVHRRKESMSSSWRAERARVPFQLARYIASVYKPLDKTAAVTSHCVHEQFNGLDEAG